VSDVLKVCDVRVGVLLAVMWVQVYYQNEKIHCTYPSLLVVGCYEHSSRLCIWDEGNCVTDSVMWCV